MNKKLKRELIEWGLFITVVTSLYLTGWHTEVLGTLQRGVLATGIITPDLDEESLGQADYQFHLRDTNNDVHKVENWKGEVLFINLWATWCPPCIAEMPDIHDLYLERKGDVRFVMISLDDDWGKARAFIEKKEYEFPVYTQVDGLPRVFHSSSIPTTFVVSADGEIVMKRQGLAQYDNEDFHRFLDGLLSQKVSNLQTHVP